MKINLTTGGHVRFPGAKLIVPISWIITGLAALHIGLVAVGFDVTTTNFVMTHLMSFAKPIQYIVGLSGLFSLLMFFSSMGCSECKM